MTADMLDANEDPIKSTATPPAVPTPELEDEQETSHWFQSLNAAEKRFHVLFYLLAGLTGILVVQVIWQIAVVTAR